MDTDSRILFFRSIRKFQYEIHKALSIPNNVMLQDFDILYRDMHRLTITLYKLQKVFPIILDFSFKEAFFIKYT